ncbi:macrophage mannose receptor 1-like protein, partial [Leptotrombidium deliense]
GRYYLYGSDDKQMKTRDIMDYFNDENCPFLKGKPKFIRFFDSEQIKYEDRTDEQIRVSNEMETVFDKSLDLKDHRQGGCHVQFLTPFAVFESKNEFNKQMEYVNRIHDSYDSDIGTLINYLSGITQVSQPIETILREIVAKALQDIDAEITPEIKIDYGGQGTENDINYMFMHLILQRRMQLKMKIKIYLLTTFTFLIVICEVVTKRCPKGWFSIGDTECLKLFPTKKSHEESKQLCNRFGGHLLTIESEVKQREVSNYVRENVPESRNTIWTWLGAKRLNESNTFVWDNGKQMVYTNWAMVFANIENTDCIQMAVNKGNESSWFTTYCDSHLAYTVCQISLKNENTNACPLGWELRSDKCYFYDEKAVTFAEAKMTCDEMHGSKLVSLYSSEDHLNLIEHTYDVNSALSPIWLGLSRAAGIESQFLWEDDNEISYEAWAVGQPLTTFINQLNSCAITGLPESFGNWFAVPCNLKYSVVCEKDAKQSNEELSNHKSKQCEKGWQRFRNRKCYKFFNDATMRHAVAKS